MEKTQLVKENADVHFVGSTNGAGGCLRRVVFSAVIMLHYCETCREVDKIKQFIRQFRLQSLLPFKCFEFLFSLKVFKALELCNCF